MDIRSNIRRLLGRPKDHRHSTEDPRRRSLRIERAKGEEVSNAEADAVSVRPSSQSTRPASLPSTSSSATSAIYHDTSSAPESDGSIGEKVSAHITSLEDIGLLSPPEQLPAVGPLDSPTSSASPEVDNTGVSAALPVTIEELASSRLQPAVVVQLPTPSPQHERAPAPSDSANTAAIATDSIETNSRAAVSIHEPPAAQSLSSVSIEQGGQQQVSSLHSSSAALLDSDKSVAADTTSLTGATTHQPDPQPQIQATMSVRKIWVKRPGASATLVAIRDDDLVDDARDKILSKYANSLGRTYDSPDVTLRVVARPDGVRPQPLERLLGPEEELCRLLDSFYPGGQTVAEALLIDIPTKKTPRPSPRHQHNNSNGHNNYHAMDEFRPHESGTDYFPIMPAVAQTATGQPPTIHESRTGHAHALQLPEHGRSISVLQTGQVPPLPSPGAASRRHRPKYARQHTSSPTIMAHGTNPSAVAALKSPNPTGQHLTLRPIIQRPRHDSNASGERPNGIPNAPPLPTPPAPEAGPTAKNSSTPPTPGGMRDHHRVPRPRKTRKVTPTNGASAAKPSGVTSLLDGSVPPINVLIVEDNIINLKLLEAFMKRLKVRWSTAMNGQIAVNKWRAGGFHLVLMDIQLPIMSGLDATKEIRRLERINGIGVFSNSQPGTPAQGITRQQSDGAPGADAEAEAEQERRKQERERDRLEMNEGLFKSPVIIVALTASSLQSDRHEALAAGCNDFLTKPVSFVWLERKVKEWGCMQALIDFDGWRRWKDFSSGDVAGDKKGITNGKAAGPTNGAGKADATAKAAEKKKLKEKRASMEAGAALGIIKSEEEAE